MDSARSWFKKFHPKKDKTSSNKETDSMKDLYKQPVDEAPSSATEQKVAAAKHYIENHYKAQMKNLQDRKER